MRVKSLEKNGPAGLGVTGFDVVPFAEFGFLPPLPFVPAFLFELPFCPVGLDGVEGVVGIDVAVAEG